MKIKFIGIGLVAFLCAGGSFAFIHQTDGVIFELDTKKSTDANLLRVQVCGEDIIRTKLQLKYNILDNLVFQSVPVLW